MTLASGDCCVAFARSATAACSSCAQRGTQPCNEPKITAQRQGAIIVSCFEALAYKEVGYLPASGGLANRLRGAMAEAHTASDCHPTAVHNNL